MSMFVGCKPCLYSFFPQGSLKMLLRGLWIGNFPSYMREPRTLGEEEWPGINVSEYRQCFMFRLKIPRTMIILMPRSFVPMDTFSLFARDWASMIQTTWHMATIFQKFSVHCFLLFTYGIIPGLQLCIDLQLPLCTDGAVASHNPLWARVYSSCTRWPSSQDFLEQQSLWFLPVESNISRAEAIEQQAS